MMWLFVYKMISSSICERQDLASLKTEQVDALGWLGPHQILYS